MKLMLVTFAIFLTFCPVFPQLINEGFEGGEIPGDWTVINNDGDDYEWTIYETDSSHTGSYCVRIHYNSDGCDDWLITSLQTVEEGYNFSFWAATNSASYLEDFNVLASHTGTSVEDFDIMIDEVVQTPFDWTLYDYDLTSVAGISAGDQIYLAIQCVSVDEWYLFVDDVYLGEVISDPVIDIDYTYWDAGGALIGNTTDPGNIFQISNIGGGILSFIALNGLNGTEFDTNFDLEIELATGQSYDFGFTYSPINEGSDEITCEIVSNAGSIEIDLEGFGVDAEFYESFESNIIPASWTVYNNDGGEYTWETASGEASHSGTYGLEKHYEDTSDDWLITPQLIVSDNDIFSFWTAAYHESYPEDFNVLASTSSNSIDDFTIILDEVSETPIEWTQYFYVLTDQPGIDPGTQVYLAIQCVSEDAYYLFIDEVMLDPELMGNKPTDLPNPRLVIHNYPNPFNPVTTFKFICSYAEKAWIEIFNLKGQKVNTISLQINQPDSPSSITWNGTDRNGNFLPGGIYFYSIQTDSGSSKPQKMVLLK